MFYATDEEKQLAYIRELEDENDQLKGIIRELLRESKDISGDLRWRATAVLAGGDTPSETTGG